MFIIDLFLNGTLLALTMILFLICLAVVLIIIFAIFAGVSYLKWIVTRKENWMSRLIDERYE